MGAEMIPSWDESRLKSNVMIGFGHIDTVMQYGRSSLVVLMLAHTPCISC